VLLYGCANPSCVPSNVHATTHSAMFKNGSAPGAFITTFNPSDAAAGAASGDEALEELLVHEWFHVTESHPSGDPNGSEWRDEIYACSRYANNCRAWDKGFYLGRCCDASSARDAAMCADQKHKADFGIQTVFVETSWGLVEKTPGTDVTIGPTCADTNNNGGQ